MCALMTAQMIIIPQLDTHIIFMIYGIYNRNYNDALLHRYCSESLTSAGMQLEREAYGELGVTNSPTTSPARVLASIRKPRYGTLVVLFNETEEGKMRLWFRNTLIYSNRACNCLTELNYTLS